MLKHLSIKNYALIDLLEVDFEDGLQIITGETGAGKSILIGGLSLVLGKRVDLSNIKNPTKKCVIETHFKLSHYELKSFFELNSIDYDEYTILRREILPSGKSRAFVNDTPVNLSLLSKLGSHLIDIHSQHETLELTQNSFQFKIIDALANNADLKKSFQLHLRNYKKIKLDLDNLKTSKQAALATSDYKQFLYDELLASNLDTIDFISIEEEYNNLSNVEHIRLELAQAIHLMNSDEIGLISTLNSLNNNLSKLRDYSKTFASLHSRITSSSIELEDISNELINTQESLSADPARLLDLENTLQSLNKLFSKHAVQTVEELLLIQESLAHEVDSVENMDANISAMEAALMDSETELHSLGQAITESREKVFDTLKQQLETILANLGMPNAKFSFGLKPSDSFLNNGVDVLSFMFCANKGGVFLPLKKAASGGELSRIMLAVKSILSQYSKLPTIMFDEIDSGVSGEVATKIGKIMSEMSMNMQVFTITHLPQIASRGNNHYKVFKKVTNSESFTQLKRLDQQERIEEIAQMLGGEKILDSALAHAKQLLN